MSAEFTTVEILICMVSFFADRHLLRVAFSTSNLILCSILIEERNDFLEANGEGICNVNCWRK